MREIYIRLQEVTEMSHKIGRMAGRAGAIGQNVRNIVSSLDWEVSAKSSISSAACSISSRTGRLAERAEVLGEQGRNAAREFEDADRFLARKMEGSLDNMRQVWNRVTVLTLISNVRVGAIGNSIRSFFDKVSDWFKGTWGLAKDKLGEVVGLLGEIRGFFSREKISLENEKHGDMGAHAATEDNVTLGSMMNSMGDGVIDTFKSTWEGIKSLFSLEGLNNLALILAPISWCNEEELKKKFHIYEGIADTVKAGFKEFVAGNANVKAYYISRIGTEILLGIVGTKGAQYVTKTVRLGKAAKVAEVIDKAGDLAEGESKVLYAENAMAKAAAEAISNAKFSRELLQGMPGFMDDMASILDDAGMSASRFDELRPLPADLLSETDRATMKAIREAIPSPTSETLMQKVIPKADIEQYLKDMDPWTGVKGYVTKAEDTKQLATYDDIYDSLRLDYKNADGTQNFYLSDGSCGVIRFKTQQAGAVEVPYSPAMGGTCTDGAPLTGNGFTASANGQAVPEFKFNNFISLEDGAELYEVYSDGREVLRGIYDKNLSRFIRK